MTLNLGCMVRSLLKIGALQVPAKGDDFKNGTG